ncbi:Coq4 family protein [Allopontixanthobacter sp.]|uniref:Coq4 family protein n=1 Tax=Allopontixanthobacter sp. TaxID=2906452 RepID=UPI002AB8A43B|nr:Coq4 family protein [Allopontixanthobacter sp.]MDZ4307978.1 Coq4 family protein [Allopontixanthobacter sp.]
MNATTSLQSAASAQRNDVARDGTIFLHPGRVPLRTRPLKAIGHWNELMKNKENTEEVFHIFECFPSGNFLPRARAFTLSEKGQAIRASEPYLPDILDDHAALRRLPDGTVAHAYVDFMEREGLSAAGLVAEHDRFRGDRPRFDDLVEWFSNRQRDVHDMLHVLTGYGRDALGEQCVLAFTYSQQPSFAHLFIAYAGGLNIKKQVKTTAPVFKAVTEAKRLGKACPRVVEMPIRELLAMPLEQARREMNIGQPVHYAAAHRVWQDEAIDPYDLLGQAKAA